MKLEYILIIIIIILIIILISYISLVLPSVIKYIKQDNKINIEEYPNVIDYGILTSEQIDVFNDILEAVKNNNEVVECKYFSIRERHEVITQLYLYYGVSSHIKNLIQWNDDKIILSLELFQDLIDKKIIIDARIDEALSTLYEGSDKYKLKQISRYIAEKIKYTENYRDTILALNGKGVCSTYAMLFYKMATRIGINTYICYGYANEFHLWNMVNLDGKNIFYDITWYDGALYYNKYIHSNTSWDRIFQINNRWSTDLENNK